MKRLLPGAGLLALPAVLLGQVGSVAPSSDDVGAARCGSCHAGQHARWTGGRHSRMIQPATAESVRGDFGRASVTLRGRRYGLRNEGGAYFVRESYLSGQERERRVDYTLGSRRVQHYLTTLDDGRIVVLPPSWDVLRQRWFHNLDIVDPDETDEVRVQVWNTNCFGCHVSQELKGYEPEARRYQTRWVDFGTSCERCHGPGRAHATSTRAADIVRPTRLEPPRATMVCAQCHSLRDITAPGYRAGDDYFDHFMPILEYAQKPGPDPAYWPDGRPRRFSNDALGLWQSRCFLEGRATCTSCHADVHQPDVDRNSQLDANGLCTGCHAEIARNVPAHTRHRAESAGSSCVECHMPRTVVSLKATMRDHTISVPAPENTRRFGIPNACTECHADKDPGWAADSLRRWGVAGTAARRLTARAEAFAGGRRSDPAALEGLLHLALDPSEGPLVRANALGYLRRYDDLRVGPALRQAVHDPHPLPRAVSTLTLGERPGDLGSARESLVGLLADDRRIVRVAAAFALVNKGVTRLPGAEGERLEAAKREYVSRAVFFDDDPETQLNLGKFYLLDRSFQQAAGALSDALRLKPDQPGTSYFLALAHVGAGQAVEARQALGKVAPNDPYHDAAKKLLEGLNARKLADPPR
jgi:predicted CXXCH cytochrome family protein